MITHMIRSKASIPHDIIHARQESSPIMIEALFRSVTGIQQLWSCVTKVLKVRTYVNKNNFLNMKIIIVDMLKHNNGSSRMTYA